MRKTIKTLLLVLVILLVCSGCKKDEIGLDDYCEDINNSMAIVKSVTNNVQAYDSNVLVYEYLNQMVLLENGGADVTKTIKSLGNSFELESKTTKETITSLNKQELFKFNLKEELLNNLELLDSSIKCEVSAENFNAVFNLQTISISGNAKCEFIFNANKLTAVKLSFTTTSLKTVEVNISYLY